MEFEDNVRGEFDFESFVARLQEWSEATFGPGERTEAILKHLSKELQEVGSAHLLGSNADVLAEFVDVIFLALGGMFRLGATPTMIVRAMEEKLAENKKRTWPDWRKLPTDQPIEHKRS